MVLRAEGLVLEVEQSGRRRGPTHRLTRHPLASLVPLALVLAAGRLSAPAPPRGGAEIIVDQLVADAMASCQTPAAALRAAVRSLERSGLQ